MNDDEVDRLTEHTRELRHGGRAEEVLQILADAHALAGDDVLHRVALLNERGLAELDAGKYVAARDTFAELVRLCEDGALDNPLVLASVLDNLGYVHRESGDLVPARDHHEKAVALLRSLDAPEDLAHALMNLAIVQKDMGLLQQATISITEAIAWAPPANEQLVGFVRSVRGLIFEMLQEWDEARREFVHALVAIRRTNDRANVAVMLHNLSVVNVERGRVAVGMRLLRRAMRINGELGIGAGSAHDLRRLALYAADAGERPKARKMLFRARREARRVGDRMLEVLCELDLARVAILTRDPRETLKRTSRALRLGRGIAAPSVMYEILVARGIGWQERCRWNQAVKTYSAALESLERLRDGFVTEELTLRYFGQASDVHRALVEMSLRRGDPHGSWLWAERTRGRELNRRIRRSVSLASRSVPPDLVAREHELLRLLDTALLELEANPTSDAAEGVDAATAQLKALWDAIRPLDPEYVAMRTGEPVTFADVRRELARWSAELRDWVPSKLYASIFCTAGGYSQSPMST